MHITSDILLAQQKGIGGVGIIQKEERENLFMELQSIENRGITIWLEGMASNSKNVAEAMSVNEECAYMRDYVFDEGELKQLRFDKVKQQ